MRMHMYIHIHRGYYHPHFIRKQVKWFSFGLMKWRSREAGLRKLKSKWDSNLCRVACKCPSGEAAVTGCLRDIPTCPTPLPILSEQAILPVSHYPSPLESASQRGGEDRACTFPLPHPSVYPSYNNKYGLRICKSLQPDHPELDSCPHHFLEWH